MLLPALLIADLHLTANPRDEYRWGLFPWLRKTMHEEKVQTLNILGDLSDAKDFHPSPLVNRMAREMRLICKEALHLRRINMIPGNHEWLKRGEEFWRFLNYVGLGDEINYMVNPGEDPDVRGPSALFLPFTRTPAADWKGLDFSHSDYVFMHQTVRGAKASNGETMEGEELPDLSAAGKVYSGDIHVPQVLDTAWGRVEYVGSPYHVHFGDSFTPRAVLIENNGRAVDLHYKSPKRVMLKVSSVEELEDLAGNTLALGDQVKLTMRLPLSEAHAWQALRRNCRDVLTAAGVEVCGVELEAVRTERQLAGRPGRGEAVHRLTPQDALLQYVAGEELGGAALEIALEVMGS